MLQVGGVQHIKEIFPMRYLNERLHILNYINKYCMLIVSTQYFFVAYLRHARTVTSKHAPTITQQ
jgi:hypothetical protein